MAYWGQWSKSIDEVSALLFYLDNSISILIGILNSIAANRWPHQGEHNSYTEETESSFNRKSANDAKACQYIEMPAPSMAGGELPT